MFRCSGRLSQACLSRAQVGLLEGQLVPRGGVFCMSNDVLALPHKETKVSSARRGDVHFTFGTSLVEPEGSAGSDCGLRRRRRRKTGIAAVRE